MATDLDGEKASETVRMAGEIGGSAECFQLDVTDQTRIEEFFSDANRRPVDVLINNAGIQHVAPLEEFSQEMWDQIQNVILRGTCLMTRAVLPGMRQRGQGRIVNIGSVHSLVASPYKSAYVAAKHGLLGFAKVIALEAADVDITINTVCPSYIRTPLVEAQIGVLAELHGMPEEEVVAGIMLEPMPKKVFISVEEVGAAIEYLGSREARNVTGQVITIDGGWTAR